MNSEFLKLKSVDFWKGLLVAVLTAAINSAYQLLLTSNDFNNINWQSIGIAAATAFLGYIIKNFLSNSNGQILKKES
jgi:hypothetical protein